MTIDEFTKFMGLPEMKVLGTIGGYKWYIVKDPLEGFVGIPTIIREHISSNIFEILNSDEALAVMGLFNENKGE